MMAFKQKLQLGNLVAVEGVGKVGDCCVMEERNRGGDLKYFKKSHRYGGEGGR